MAGRLESNVKLFVTLQPNDRLFSVVLQKSVTILFGYLFFRMFMQILESCHAVEGHHLGRDKTVKRLKAKFYWLGMVSDVKDLVRTWHSVTSDRFFQ